MKITFYLVRHGETLFNHLGRMQGSCAVIDPILRCPGMEPQQLHSAAGRIRVGWFRFGIRTARSTLPLLA